MPADMAQIQDSKHITKMDMAQIQDSKHITKMDIMEKVNDVVLEKSLLSYSRQSGSFCHVRVKPEPQVIINHVTCAAPSHCPVLFSHNSPSQSSHTGSTKWRIQELRQYTLSKLDPYLYFLQIFGHHSRFIHFATLH